jgi:hypothetical protein
VMPAGAPVVVFKGPLPDVDSTTLENCGVIVGSPVGLTSGPTGASPFGFEAGTLLLRRL